MQISILLMEQIFELFLMILMGFIIVKAGIVKEEDSKVLSKIVLYLIIPCVIINAFQVDYTKKTVNGLLIALAASVLLQVVLLLVVFVMGKLFSLNEVETASIYYSNSGNLIVPIVTFVLGQKWILYGCVFMSVQLIFLWTHCKKIISRESSYDWKKIILNINMISIAIGAILFFTRIRLPELITNTISSVGNMIGPASMIVTGMLFAGMDLKAIFANKRVYFISALRMLVIPLIALFLIKISHLATLSADAQKIMLIVFLAVITPSASTVTQMCQAPTGLFVSGVRKRCTLCQRNQRSDHAVCHCDHAFYGAVVFLYLTVYFRFFLQYRIKSYHKRTSTAPITIAFTTSGICPSPNPNSTIKKTLSAIHSANHTHPNSF